MEVDIDSGSVDKLEIVNDNNDVLFKNRMFLKYDDDSGSIPPSLEEVGDSSTDDSFFLLGTLILSHTMNVLNWSSMNPGMTTTGQRSLCPGVNAQSPFALQIRLGQSKADDS
jgi:hypothetical protein